MTDESFVRVFPEVLAIGVCRDLIARFERTLSRTIASHEFSGGGSAEANDRVGRVLTLDHSDECSDCVKLIHVAVETCLEQYAVRFPGVASLLAAGHVLTLPRIERIEAGGGFTWHSDTRHASADRRFLSVLIYLNDLESSGRTTFFHQGLEIEPRTGYGVLFPPFWTHLHAGEPPSTSAKYTLGLFVSAR